MFELPELVIDLVCGGTIVVLAPFAFADAFTLIVAVIWVVWEWVG